MELESLDSCIAEKLSPEIFQFLKPGAHCLVLSTPRTNHVVATEAEDMGFEIRDVISHVGRTATDFWILCRKPLEEKTVIENVLKYGTGGLHIDVCRVGSEARKNSQKDTTAWSGNNWSGAPQKGNGQYKEVTGRFPANFIMSHTEDCELAGTKNIKAIGGGKTSGSNAFGQDSGWNEHNNRPTDIKRVGNEDGTETVENWVCHPDCPVYLLDAQSGILKSGAEGPSGVNRGSGENFSGGWSGGHVKGAMYGDSGGASRFFYTAKSNQEALDYLTQLITPAEGTTHVFR